MHLDKLVNPLVLATAVSVAVAAACLVSMWILMRGVNADAVQHKDRFQALEKFNRELRGELDAILRAQQEAEQHRALPARPAPGMNLSRRSHVLRMTRRGDRPDQIAATLGVPRAEVDLLLKVHRAVIARL